MNQCDKSNYHDKNIYKQHILFAVTSEHRERLTFRSKKEKKRNLFREYNHSCQSYLST